MKKKAIILISLFASISYAAPPVTYQFTNGTTIEASQINSNYQELADRIEVLQNLLLTLQSNTQKSLIGYTTALSTNSNGEYIKLSQLCYSEFNDSRICTSKEVLETVNPPTLGVTERAWAMPTSIIPSPTTAGISYDSFTGVGGGDTLESSINCLSIGTNQPLDASCADNFNLYQYRVACCR